MQFKVACAIAKPDLATNPLKKRFVIAASNPESHLVPAVTKAIVEFDFLKIAQNHPTEK